ncbi:hypothetical protein MBANPS3_008122 [Mucor bainieri]
MNEQESMIDMGKRPSRQRRHLPTSITSAAKTRSDKERRNIALINMFNEKKDDNSSKSTSYEPATTTTIRRKPHQQQQQQQQQQIHKQKARQFVTKSKTTAVSTTKLIIYTLGSLWIAFVIYRIYYNQENYMYNSNSNSTTATAATANNSGGLAAGWSENHQQQQPSSDKPTHPEWGVMKEQDFHPLTLKHQRDLENLHQANNFITDFYFWQANLGGYCMADMIQNVVVSSEGAFVLIRRIVEGAPHPGRRKKKKA